MWPRPSTTWPSCTGAQGKYAEAEGLYKRALAIDEKALGADHPDVATTLTTWPSCTAIKASTPTPRGSTSARWRSTRRRSAQTTRCGRRPSTTWPRVQGARQVRRRRGALQARAGDPGEGARRQTIPMWLRPSNNLAVVYCDQGKYADAEGLYKRALAIKEKALGADHPDVANALDNLARVYDEQGKYADAEALHKRALAIRRRRSAPTTPLWPNPQQPGRLYERKASTPTPRRSTSARWRSGEGARRQPPRCGRNLNNLAILSASSGNSEERTRLFAQSDSFRHRSRSRRDDWRAAQGGHGRSRRAARGLLCSSCRQSCGGGAEADRARGEARPRSSRHGAMGETVRGRGRGPANGPALCRRHRCACSAGARAPGPLRLLARARQGADRGAVQAGRPAATPRAIDASASRLPTTESKLAANAARLAGEFPGICGAGEPKAAQRPRKCSNCSAPTRRWSSSWLGDKESYVFALTREAFEWKTIPLGAQGAVGEGRRIPPRARCRCAAARIGTGGVHASGSGQARTVARGVRRGCREGVRAGCSGRSRPRAQRVQPTAEQRELFDLGLAHELYEHAHRSGRGADQGQAASHRGALGRAHGAAVPSAGDGEARGRGAAGEDAARSRGLSRCRVAAQAACGERAAVGGEPQGACGVFARKEQAQSR